VQVAEKQNLYKHYREEYEAARKAEEEKFIKAMRREMVVLARPVPKFDRPFVPQRCVSFHGHNWRSRSHVSQ
jgi:targeting protein for Xklp2